MLKLRVVYTREQKLTIVNENIEEGIHLNELSDRYNIHPSTIRRWRRELIEFNDNAFPGPGIKKQTEEQREISRLKKELRESQIANEILKKAMGIVASPNRKDLLS